ncbi:glyoxalase-like protein [Acidovorax sp. 100]|uniref:VOC family protein n=1 Tax=Acidovorax sp. 100 TaxID=2135635 RepID=UPI000EFA0E6F|nr:VOC family protein [Acidovorax sp. 100]RMA61325.1 glyoxalase-like protein [Acidovorax sp. 100]
MNQYGPVDPACFAVQMTFGFTERMASRLDHITIVAPSLDAGSAYVETALGVAPGPGREHPSMATHNLLLALGPSVYLEVIAANRDAAPVSRARWFGIDDIPDGATPRLAAWVASTNDIAAATVPAIGQVETMHRDSHTWRMAFRPDGALALDGAVPLLIQRAADANPVAALPTNPLHFRSLHIVHPAPEEVLALFAAIGLASTPRVTVAQGAACALVAEIQTPSGLRRLGGA